VILDCNAYLGEWTFRETRHASAGGLLRLLDKYGIDKACVTHLAGLFYKNAHNANRRLRREIRSHRPRLVPFCVINPFYPGWEDDLTEALQDIGAKAVALYPSLHNYSLLEGCGRRLLERCAEEKIPVALSERIEDERQEHWLFKIPNLPQEEICRAAKENPRVRFLIRDALPLRYQKALQQGNCYFDFSRSDITASHAHASFFRKLSRRLLFGTQLPLKTPLPAILKVEKSDLPSATKERIFSGNARDLLGV
jgi:predicted TIM-barrel fold metal-dependent hydrolase